MKAINIIITIMLSIIFANTSIAEPVKISDLTISAQVELIDEEDELCQLLIAATDELFIRKIFINKFMSLYNKSGEDYYYGKAMAESLAMQKQAKLIGHLVNLDEAKQDKCIKRHQSFFNQLKQ